MKTQPRLGLWTAFFACWCGFSTLVSGHPVNGTLPLRRVLSEPAVEDRLKRGTPSTTIAEEFGSPDHVLPSEVWVYWNMSCADARSVESGYDTLVVQFADGRLRKARLVRGDQLRALLSRPGQGQGRTPAAAP